MKPMFVDYENGVISLSSAFKKRAFTPGTTEYRELNKVRHDFPDFGIEIREFQTNKKQDRYKGLTYDYMRWYITKVESKENAITSLDALEHELDKAKCHSKGRRYPTIKRWFLQRYPDVEIFGMTDEELAEWKAAQKSYVIDLPSTGTEG